MSRTWGPSAAGKLFTRSTDWILALTDERFSVRSGAIYAEGRLACLETLRVEPGHFWSAIAIPIPDGRPLSLDGIPNAAAAEMATVIAQAVRRVRITQLIANFNQAIKPTLQWVQKARAACKAQIASRGWLTEEFKAAFDGLKPKDLADLLVEPELIRHLDAQSAEIKAAVSFWKTSFRTLTDAINERHLAQELQDSKAFFDTVEKSPLSEEQACAVLCFDNRVLLVASAGSGKTSTMVAKAGYALSKGYFAADKILLLAFNSDAAAELRERIDARLRPLGLPADRIVAKTFHAFGLDVIGQATGKRPSLASWLENGRDLDALLVMVDELKDRDTAFRTNWDLFRIVLGHDLPRFGEESAAPDSWDSTAQKEGFWTLNGEVVKSRGEQILANWLFYNGVKYQYEAPYRLETADAEHRQYQPDFYFPDIDVYLEHWALDEKGNPPPAFVGYREGMLWKKKLHADNQTTLLETTMAGLWSGDAIRHLATELTQRGIVLDPNPDRTVPGRKPIENPRLARTFRTFLTHAKSNRLTIADLRNRLNAGFGGNFRFRHHVFLSLFEKLWTAWEGKLKREQCIDFEDMLGLAADCIEQDRWKSPYDLIMVDEFQDASQARARLVAGLLKAPGKHLFAVGDDWQSINRFAGSDLAVMTDFEAKFGHAVTLKLERTYRCPQSLCDVSSCFIQKNPNQIRKSVRSVRTDVSEPIRIVQVSDEKSIQGAIATRIQELAETSRGKNISIYVLGRYNKEREHLPLQCEEKHVTVEFTTVHASKGLEADHVIIPRLTAETLGFPSRIVDDPVLQLAMPGGDAFEDAEERRLFYVALTRARSTVTLITVEHKQSPFVAELVRDHKLRIVSASGVETSSEVCPSCRQGFFVLRKGKYGPFYGCSRYPKCRHTKKIDRD